MLLFLEDLQIMSTNKKPPSSPSKGYFAKLKTFEPDQEASLVQEFNRLALSQGWSVRSKRYKKEKQKCFAEEFEQEFGAEEGKLKGWQQLCRDVGIEPRASITQCKKVLPIYL